jgi:uncharacterized damage-inducible protein DinB
MTMSLAEEIQDRLARSRERLLVAIELLPDEALLEANAVQHFSVAELLAHLTAWEAEMVTGLMRLNQGKKPGRLLAALEDTVAYDAKRYPEYQGRELDAIFDDLQRVRVQLEAWLEEFSDRDLAGTRRYEWFKGKSLARVIAETSYEKEAHYLLELSAFARAWLMSSDAPVDVGEA